MINMLKNKAFRVATLKWVFILDDKVSTSEIKKKWQTKYKVSEMSK